jgi:hypothetical protein
MKSAMAVLDSGKAYDLFEIVSITDEAATVRTPFRFELGEELAVRVEHAGQSYEARATVRAHTGDTTELALRRES